MLLTGLLLTTHSTYFLHNPGVVLPATLIISGQTAPQTCLQANLIQALSQFRFSLPR